jgi:hypothetical protein
MPRFMTLTATAPAHWASYLINGDPSGIEDSEAKDADAFCERVLEEYPSADRGPVSCSEDDEDFTGSSNAHHWGFVRGACDCIEYRWLVPGYPNDSEPSDI